VPELHEVRTAVTRAWESERREASRAEGWRKLRAADEFRPAYLQLRQVASFAP
jgi:hypothetical protein